MPAGFHLHKNIIVCKPIRKKKLNYTFHLNMNNKKNDTHFLRLTPSLAFKAIMSSRNSSYLGLGGNDHTLHVHVCAMCAYQAGTGTRLLLPVGQEDLPQPYKMLASIKELAPVMLCRRFTRRGTAIIWEEMQWTCSLQPAMPTATQPLLQTMSVNEKLCHHTWEKEFLLLVLPNTA